MTLVICVWYWGRSRFLLLQIDSTSTYCRSGAASLKCFHLGGREGKRGRPAHPLSSRPPWKHPGEEGGPAHLSRFPVAGEHWGVEETESRVYIPPTYNPPPSSQKEKHAHDAGYKMMQGKKDINIYSAMQQKSRQPPVHPGAARPPRQCRRSGWARRRGRRCRRRRSARESARRRGR